MTAATRTVRRRQADHGSAGARFQETMTALEPPVRLAATWRALARWLDLGLGLRDEPLRRLELDIV